MMTVFVFIAGLIFLVLGAELLVRGASRLAAGLGISPLIIGLTVVSFGTSAPELAVSIKSALSGQAGIALGNVIGSNTFNILVVLGLSALVAPLVVSRRLIRFDVPLMIGVSVLAWMLGLDGTFGRTDGCLLFLGLMVYVGFLIHQSRRERGNEKVESANPWTIAESVQKGWLKNAGLVISGLALLVFGSRWLVGSAEIMAKYMGVNEAVVGLTVVAAGTSLPELVTSLVASIRGERDIAVGNVVGSNLFNIMGVLGLSSMLAPSGIEVAGAMARFDLPIMMVAAFACLPIFFTGGKISRWEGFVLFGYYAAYTLYLLLATSQHEALPLFSKAMLYFVGPLTMMTLAVLSVRAMRAGRSVREK